MIEARIIKISDEGVTFFVEAPKGSDIWKKAIESYSKGGKYNFD